MDRSGLVREMQDETENEQKLQRSFCHHQKTSPVSPKICELSNARQGSLAPIQDHE